MHRRVKNASFESGLIRISASCSSVGVYIICNRPDFTLDMKWWYFNAMYLVHGEIFPGSHFYTRLIVSMDLTYELGLLCEERKYFVDFFHRSHQQ